MPVLPVRRRLHTDIYEHSRSIRGDLRSPQAGGLAEGTGKRIRDAALYTIIHPFTFAA